MSSLADRAYDEIRRRLSAGEFDAADTLSEPSLARELNVSRTPVREAIRRLEAEGLLEQRAKQGTFVRRPDRREMLELYDLRLLLEPAAAAAAARRRTAGDLSELAARLDEMRRLARAIAADPEDAERVRAHAAADRAFHQVILDAAGNRTVARMAADAGLLGRVLGVPKDRPDALPANLRAAYREHRAVSEAVRDADPAAARKAMRAHLSRGRRMMRDYFAWLDRAAGDPAGPPPSPC